MKRMGLARMAALAVALIGGSDVVGAASSEDSHPPLAEAADQPGYDLLPGTNQFGVWAGGAFSATTLFGGLNEADASGRRIALVGFRYGRVLLRREGFALQYFADVLPLALEVNSVVEGKSDAVTRSTIYGAGLSPLGARLIFRPAERLKPFLGISGGILLFAEDVPVPGTRKLNFTGDIEAGLQFWTTRRRAFVGAVRFHHASNAGTGETNPGLNAFTLFFGYSLFR